MMAEHSQDYVLSVDQGTSSTRVMVFDRAGRVAAVSQMEHKQYTPHPGWVAHKPLEIWDCTVKCMREAVRKLNQPKLSYAGALAEAKAEVAGGSSGKPHTPSHTLAQGSARLKGVAAVGITNQRETTMVWDKHTGKPLCDAIVWNDSRTAALVRELEETQNPNVVSASTQGRGADRLRALTGLPLATYFSGVKLKWILDNVEGVRQAAEAGTAIFGTVDTWLVWNMTGGALHITDVTNASRTMLMNLNTMQWDDDLLKFFGVPRCMLPDIVSSSAVLGEATVTPIAGIPIAGILGDQQAALFGQGCLQLGEAKCTYGTGAFILVNTGQQQVPSTTGCLTTVAYKIGDQPAHFALEGSVAYAGSLIQWLRDNVGIIADAAQTEQMALDAADNGGVYLVPAFSGLYAPYWRTDARGIIVGLTAYNNKNHLVRAAIESTAFQVADVLSAMNADLGSSIQVLKVDGGMTANCFLMQFQSDLLQVHVVRPEVAETTALGAAYAAGLATGLWSSTEDILERWRKDHEWEPQMHDSDRTHHLKMWSKAVRRSMGWLSDDDGAEGSGNSTATDARSKAGAPASWCTTTWSLWPVLAALGVGFLAGRLRS